MDNSGREREEDMFELIRHTEGGSSPEGGSEEEGPITDGSEFLNPTGEGMEPEQIRDEAQTSVDCDDDDHNVGPVVTKSGEVY
jgi:hypothetical protein